MTEPSRYPKAGPNTAMANKMAEDGSKRKEAEFDCVFSIPRLPS
jgi:hypothetical protein